MNLRTLRSLVTVAGTGSFTAAAASLHIAQPAISQHVKSLEQELGVELIDRRTKAPTAAGAAVIERAERALGEVESIPSDIAAIRGVQSGAIRAGAIHWLAPFDLPGLLGSFAHRFPGVSVELHEENADDMFAMLEKGTLDVVFSNIAPGDVARSPLARRNLFTEELVVGMSPIHELAGKRIGLDQLTDETFIAFRPGSAFRDTVQRALESAGVTPNIVLESSDLVTIRSLAARGLGIALMPRSLAVHEGPPLGIARIVPASPERTVALTWNASGVRTSAATAFVDFTQDWLDTTPTPI